MINLKKKKSRKLDLSGKNLDKFPDSVFADKKIVSLILSDNQIKEIPAKIRELKDLRYLHLENNQITQLHNGILEPKSLRCLYLKGNPMKKLPDFVKENAKFTISMDSGIHHYYSKVTLEGGNRKLQQEIITSIDIDYFNSENHDTTLINIASDRGICLTPGFFQDYAEQFAWIPFECEEKFDCYLCVHTYDKRESLKEFII